MNLAQQRKTIAVSAMLVFALGALSHAEKGQLPTARFLIGAGGIYTLISVFADFGSPLGAGMAIVILLTAILTEGSGVINLLAKRAGTKVPAEGPEARTTGLTPAEMKSLNNIRRYAKSRRRTAVEPGSVNPERNPKALGPTRPFEIPNNTIYPNP